VWCGAILESADVKFLCGSFARETRLLAAFSQLRCGGSVAVAVFKNSGMPLEDSLVRGPPSTCIWGHFLHFWSRLLRKKTLWSVARLRYVSGTAFLRIGFLHRVYPRRWFCNVEIRFFRSVSSLFAAFSHNFAAGQISGWASKTLLQPVFIYLRMFLAPCGASLLARLTLMLGGAFVLGLFDDFFDYRSPF